MRMHILIALGVAWFGFSGAKGCLDLGSAGPEELEPCTQVACVDFAAIRFEPALTAEGTYSITVVIDGEPVECVAQVPGSLYDACASRLITIDSQKMEIELERNGERRTTVIEKAGIAGISISERMPRSISIEVSRDGSQVLLEDVSPAYESFFVNGPDCPGLCYRSTSVVLTE